MKTFFNPDKALKNQLTERPVSTLKEIEPLVQEVFEAVKQNGDKALKFYAEKFDRVQLSSFKVDEQSIADSSNYLDDNLMTAIKLAKNNIEAFHKAQKTERVVVETMPGVKCWQEKKAIQKVGLYIPGGTAPLFSTILMLAIPAQIAGCKEIVLCTPSDAVGNVNPAILYTAKLCGVTKIYKLGGIQAIAAMTLGTESIDKVYKIFGPGNAYVTAAKQYATKLGVAIDMPAGPSELMVLADESANEEFIASDLLSQAEHGVDSQVVLVSTNKTMLTKVENALKLQLKALERQNIATKALEHARFLYFDHIQEAIDWVNDYAPEHLIICTTNNNEVVGQIQNAGSVFIGNYTPESAGDYASGTNHTLPTSGYSKSYSGVNLDAFTKSITYQEITSKGIQGIGSAIELMAKAEGLTAHQNAVTIRLNQLKNSSDEI